MRKATKLLLLMISIKVKIHNVVFYDTVFYDFIFYDAHGQYHELYRAVWFNQNKKVNDFQLFTPYNDDAPLYYDSNPHPLWEELVERINNHGFILILTVSEKLRASELKEDPNWLVFNAFDRESKRFIFDEDKFAEIDLAQEGSLSHKLVFAKNYLRANKNTLDIINQSDDPEVGQGCLEGCGFYCFNLRTNNNTFDTDQPDDREVDQGCLEGCAFPDCSNACSSFGVEDNLPPTSEAELNNVPDCFIS